MKVGFIYMTVALFYSGGTLIEFIGKLDVPKWVNIILYTVAFFLWLSGAVFMYNAEIAVMAMKGKVDKN